MIVTLQTQRVQTLEQVRRVAEGNEPVDFALAERASAYEFIGRTLVQFDYAALGKADKGAVKAYLGKMTGLSRAQLTRLMAQHRSTRRLRDRRSASREALVVVDRGIATEEQCVKWLRENAYRYLVVSRERTRHFDPEAAQRIETAQRQGVHLHKAVSDDGQEVRLHCFSEERANKERAIVERFATGFDQALTKLSEGLLRPRTEKRAGKIRERIGRLKAKSRGIAQHYHIDIDTDPSGERATAVRFTRQPVRRLPEDREAPELECEVVQVRLAELTLHAPRQWGACWLALTLWERLELDRFWGPRLPASREGTRWLDILKIQVCYRLIDPGSDWRLHRQWYEHSALRDLLGCDRVIASTTLYRCLDKLTAHKQEFFSFLRARWTTLFNARFDIVLYERATD